MRRFGTLGPMSALNTGLGHVIGWRHCIASSELDIKDGIYYG